MCMLLERREGKRVSRNILYIICHFITMNCLCSPFVHVAKRVDDNNLYAAAYPQYGNGTVWPGYGYPMDDGEEFAHGKQLYYVVLYECVHKVL